MSHSSSGPQMPWEVIERVIDILHWNVPALRQIAVACRSLLPRSRYHLFHAIRFQPTQEDAYSLCDFLDANLSLAALVEAATVYFPESPRPAKAVRVIEVFPLGLLKRLPSLRHWKLSTGATKSPETPRSFHPTTLAFLRTTIRLETLEIKDFTFTSNTELSRLLTSLPFLLSLRCSNVSIKSQRTTTLDRPAHVRRHRAIRRLCVRTDSLRSTRDAHVKMY